jgi:2-(3-amino-3-carboxypropyl)histidine synthase
LKVKDKLEAKGRSAILFAVREVTPEMMMGFPTIDAYVNTACPRISMDDSSKFKKPVLTMNEAFVAIGDLSWEELCKRGLLES